MQVWKAERRALLDVCLCVPGLVEFVLDYAYEIQGSLMFTIEKLTEFDAWVVARLSPRAIATASHDSSVCVWDFKTGALRSTLSAHSAKICGLAVLDEQVVSVSRDCTARVWDADQGLCVRTLFHPAPVDFATQFDGCLLTACADGCIRLWEPDGSCSQYTVRDAGLIEGTLHRSLSATETGTHQVLSLEAIGNHALALRTIVRTCVFAYASGEFSLVYQTDGNHLDEMVVTPEHTLIIFNAQEIHVWNRSLQGRVVWLGAPMFTVCALHDGRVAASCQDNTVRVFNPQANAVETSIDCLHTNACCELDCAQCELANRNFFWHLVQLPDGRLAGAEGPCVNVWDLSTRECVLWRYYSCDVTNLTVINSKLVVGCGTPCDECECKPGYGCKNCGQLYVVE
jgi:WD40 repeat protein